MSLLIHFDFKIEICVEINASIITIVEILIQKLPAGAVNVN